MIRRWWLWLTNPTPLVGQVWSLDGVGLVFITAVEQEDGTLFVNGDPRGGTPECSWPYAEFISQATLRVRLADLQDSAPTVLREVQS